MKDTQKTQDPQDTKGKGPDDPENPEIAKNLQETQDTQDTKGKGPEDPGNPEIAKDLQETRDTQDNVVTAQVPITNDRYCKKMATVYLKMNDLPNFRSLVSKWKVEESWIGYKFIDACRSGATSIVKSLVEYGVNVNVCDTIHGSTGLMHAAQQGQFDVVQCLLAAGANPLKINQDSKKTARDYAANRRVQEVLIVAESIQQKIDVEAIALAAIRADLEKSIRAELRATEVHHHQEAAISSKAPAHQGVRISDIKDLPSGTVRVMAMDIPLQGITIFVDTDGSGKFVPLQ